MLYPSAALQDATPRTSLMVLLNDLHLQPRADLTSLRPAHRRPFRRLHGSPSAVASLKIIARQRPAKAGGSRK